MTKANPLPFFRIKIYRRSDICNPHDAAGAAKNRFFFKSERRTDGSKTGAMRRSGPRQRSFKVASAASASTPEMIQKRTTICVSVQPLRSK